MIVEFFLTLDLLIKHSAAYTVSGLHTVLRVSDGLWPSNESAKNTGNQRVRAQPVGAVISVFTLTGGEDPFYIGRLFVIHPEAAHGVVHAGKDLHRNFTRIVADKLLVDFQNAFELAVQRVTVYVSQIEIDHGLAVNAQALFVNDSVDRASGHITRYQVAVLGKPFFQEVKTFGLGNAAWFPIVPFVSGHPDAAALPTRRFRHQAQLVCAGNRGGVHLDEFAISVKAALLVERRLRRAGADHGVRRFAKDSADATGSDDNGVGREDANLHAAQVHGADAATDAVGIDHAAQKFPMLKLCHASFGFVPPNLFVQCVQELLAGGGSGECRAMVERAAKPAKIEQAFGRAIEGHSHAVQQINNAGRGFAHGFHRRLIGEEIAAVDGVVKMLPGSIAFALKIFGSVDSTLSTD